MKPRLGVPALYEVVLPAGGQPPRDAVDEAARLAAHAAGLYRAANFLPAGEGFMTAARRLLDPTAAGGPDLAGTRSVCYFNAVLAAIAGGAPETVDEIKEWVSANDPACSRATSDLVGQLRRAGRDSSR